MSSQFDKIHEMFLLQNTLNNHTAGVSWFVRPDVVFENAIIAEAAELLESLKYKWWKLGAVDADNVKVEVVDLWHFTMSLIMQEYGTDEHLIDDIVQSCTGITAAEVRSSGYLLREGVKNYIREVLNFRKSDEKDIDTLVRAFADVMCNADMTFDDLYSMYIIKNALNKFRQDNGYTTGEYSKMWAGKEDNEVAMEHCKGLTFEQTLVKLQALYNLLKETR